MKNCEGYAVNKEGEGFKYIRQVSRTSSKKLVIYIGVINFLKCASYISLICNMKLIEKTSWNVFLDILNFVFDGQGEFCI